MLVITFWSPNSCITYSVFTPGKREHVVPPPKGASRYGIILVRGMRSGDTMLRPSGDQDMVGKVNELLCGNHLRKGNGLGKLQKVFDISKIGNIVHSGWGSN